MGNLLYTKKIPFSLKDWKNKKIVSVTAGADCIMAITKDGEVLQKITEEHAAAATKFWKNIKDIAVSKVCPGIAIGLVNDGTCMIAKKPLRDFVEGKANFVQWGNFEDVEIMYEWEGKTADFTPDMNDAEYVAALKNAMQNRVDAVKGFETKKEGYDKLPEEALAAVQKLVDALN